VNTVLWIVAGLLAVVFLAGGVTKLTRSREQLAGSGFGFVEDLGDGMVRTIGALELLAAVGLTVPAALDVVPVLVPVTAVGVVLLMVGAVITHLRRREAQVVAVPLLLLALAVVVAWGRFGPESFTG
jgi:hypothetical protein